MIRRLPPRLLWISPGEGTGERLMRTLAACVRGGLRAFQLREKSSFARDLRRAAVEIRRLLPAGEGLVLVNDRVDVAQVAPVDGVHLGGGSLTVAEVRRLLGPAAWIGRSVHDELELAEAVEGGADFVLASPVFPVRKRGVPGAPPLGLVGLGKLVRASPLPVLGLGGIRLDNVGEVLASGAHGVAVMRSIIAAEDPRALVEAYLREIG